MGLGNVVGALLSGVVAIPGVLVGTGVGAIHGPWYKLKDAISGKGDGETPQAGAGGVKSSGGDLDTDDDAEAHQAIVEAARKLEAEEGSRGNGEGGGDEAAGGDKSVDKKMEAKQEDMSKPDVEQTPRPNEEGQEAAAS